MTTSQTLPTFEVDKEGLRKVLARKGYAWILPELLQNAWDEESSHVEAKFLIDLNNWRERDDEQRTFEYETYLVIRDDDPDGFTDISHAYTLFAESEKKGDSEKRGRFNVGEKLVVAAAERLTVSTTTGVIVFDHEGRKMAAPTRDHGTEIEAIFWMSEDEYREALDTVALLFPPAGVETIVNGDVLPYREPVRTFTDTLRTPVGAELKIRDRKATVSLYPVQADETPHLYEMGIPVVELRGGDPWHIDIGQKVPLNVERDNVTPKYLQDVRALVLDHAHDLLTDEQATDTWATDAMKSDKVSAAALGTVIQKRFGDKAVIFDPSDREANSIAVSEGYTLVSGGMLPGAAWKNVKAHGLLKPAGQVTPSPKPYSTVGHSKTRQVVPPEKWTADIRRMVRFVQELSRELMGVEVSVEIVNDPQTFGKFGATYGRTSSTTGDFEFNLLNLGHKWFAAIGEQQISLIIHEFGHQYESDHLSRNYYRALTDLGARLALAIVNNGPEWWADITKGDN